MEECFPVRLYSPNTLNEGGNDRPPSRLPSLQNNSFSILTTAAKHTTQERTDDLSQTFEASS